MSTVQFAGFSRLNGVLKFRTANEISRAQQLAKLGDTDVSMAILPNPMTKNDAAKYVLTNLAISYPAVNQTEAQLVLTNLIKDENPFAKVKKTAKPKTVKATGVKIKVSKDNDDFIYKKIPGTNRVVQYEKNPETFSPKESAKIRAEFMKKLKEAYEAN
jgi:hypothetical protein